MASPKKKLSGKVQIDLPRAEAGADDSKLESSKQETGLEDSIKTLNQNKKIESIKQENKKIENKKIESIKPESTKQSENIDFLPESVIQDYKKVAMRLSVTAAEKLRQLRADTGIPYEILVDVMIRHWDDLANQTKVEYLQEAKVIRQARLLAGQQKAIETMQQKYH